MKICCPSCESEPQKAHIWKCFCGHKFNHFANIAKCPSCGYSHEFTECLEPSCKTISLHLDWYKGLTIKHKELINSINLSPIFETKV